MSETIEAQERVTAPRPYHHGDLARVLAEAAAALVRETGINGFSLRECARRAGVAHSAPGHHYGDVTGLLTEVAARGFLDLARALASACSGTSGAPVLARLARRYVDFALGDPIIFGLMFHSDRVNRGSPRFQRAGEEAFAQLVRAVAEARGQSTADAEALRFAWASMHGMAMLLIDGPLVPAGGNRRGGAADLATGTIARMVFAVTRFDARPGTETPIPPPTCRTPEI